ncbi:AMP-binding protein [Streptomyces sp. NPDC005761]|uniref:AMP-binding protein n=1 Tax=Streptomyces sp. NPDC005761 TaxID=3157066 RepID=UPI0033D57250
MVRRDRRRSYGEFGAVVRRAATVPREAGPGPGDRMAVMTYHSPAYLYAAFDAWPAGATPVPVNRKPRTESGAGVGRRHRPDPVQKITKHVLRRGPAG